MKLIIKVAINSEIKHKADLSNNPAARRSLTFNYQIKILTIDELAEEIRQRHNITSICFNELGRFHRKKEFFRQADIFAIDIDEGLLLEVALIFWLVKDYAAIVYTTPSHTPELHKFRIVFVLPRTIYSLEEFELIVRCFIWLFQSDESCKDASRFFFGTGPNGQVIVIGNRLTDQVIKHILDKYQEAHTQPQREEHPP